MKISVVTPSYNSERYIRETILSVKNQNYPNFEHIIMDGASKDGTLSILSEYPHLLVKSEEDTGQSNALNKGFEISKGDILAWQNADDTYLPGTFETVVNFFQSHPKADFVYGYYQLIDSQSKWVCDVHPMQWNTWMFSHGRFCPLQPTVFWRRRVFESVGKLNEDLHYCMDVDFFARSINKGFTFSLIPEILGQFRIHDQSKTQNSANDQKVYKEYKDVLAANFRYSMLDNIFFEFFKRRAKVTRRLKQKFLKKI